MTTIPFSYPPKWVIAGFISISCSVVESFGDFNNYNGSCVSDFFVLCQLIVLINCFFALRGYL